MDAVMMLRQALDAELNRLVTDAAGLLPQLDGATLASLFVLYGIETGIGVGAITRPDMAGYLRIVAEALEDGAEFWPTLSSNPPSHPEAPTF